MKRIVGTLIILIFSFGANAELRFKTLNVKNKLELYETTSLCRDSIGYLWIGNSKGLSRYDSREVITYPIEKEIRTYITCIKELNSRKLLVCSTSGLLEFDKFQGKFKCLIKYSDSSAAYWIETSSNKHTYYVGSKGLLDIYNVDKNTVKRYILKRDGNPVSIRYILHLNDNSLWLATTCGVCHFSPSHKTYQFITPKNVGIVNCLCVIENKLYIATETGLYNYSFDRKTISELPGFENCIITSFAKADESKLYLCTNGFGLILYDVKNGRIVNRFINDVQNQNSIPTNSLYNILYDRDSILWIGTATSGLSYTQRYPQKFSAYTYGGNISLQKQVARSMYIGENEKLIGTRDGLIVTDMKGNSKIYKANIASKNIRANIVLSILPYPDKKNIYLIGTYGGGVSLFNSITGEFSIFINHPAFIHSKVYSIIKDSSGFVWIGTLDGIFKCELKDKPHITAIYNPGFETRCGGINSLLSDDFGRIWIGGDFGLTVLNVLDGRYLEESKLANMIKDRIVSFYQDKAKHIWICTLTSGLYVMDEKLNLVCRYTEKNGLVSNSPVAVQQDSKGFYWISTRNGFTKLANGVFRNYTIADGLPGKLFLQSSSTQDKMGNLWFGCETGLMCFNPQLISINHTNPITTISRVFINNEEKIPTLKSFIENVYNKQKIYGRENSLKISFAALNFNNSEDNKFKYKLVGVDKKWRVSTTNNVEYRDLSAGDYKFIVLGSNNDEVWSLKPATMSIQVSYYFYQTFWFIALIIILFLSGIFWIFNYYFTRVALKLKDQIVSSLPIMDNKESLSTKQKLSDDRINEIYCQVKNYMDEQKPYLDVNFKFSRVAASTGYQQNDISQAINLTVNESFSDFINRYRVNEFIQRMNNGEWDNLKITAIAFDCGFYSKASFYRAFKKVTGSSPSDYFKDVD